LKGEAFILLEKILKAPSIDALLILGAFSIQYVRQQLDTILDLIKASEDRKETVGYAI
jgi:hypothetical protein